MFNPIREPRDYLIVGGEKVPILVDVSGASSTREWDERKIPYADGAILVSRGKKPSRFTTTFRLCEDADFEAWESFRLKIDKLPGYGSRGKAAAFDLTHPLLDDVGVSKAVVEEIGQATPLDDTGWWSIAVKWIEYKPIADGGPKKIESSKATPNDPVDHVDLQIEALVKQRDALADADE